MKILKKQIFTNLKQNISNILSKSTFESLWFCLIIFCALIPRELNVRIKPLSFSLTDIVFIFLLIGIISKFFCHLNTQSFTWLKKKAILTFVFTPALVVILVALLDIFFKGVENKHIFFRDIYTFSILPLTFLAISLINLDIKKFIFILFVMNTLLAFWAIIVVKVPFISEWYVVMGKKFEIIGGNMGYFMPGGGRVGLLSEAEIGKYLRPIVFIGGCGHIGWLALWCLPIFFEHLDILRKRLGSLLTPIFIVTIMVAFLCEMSRALILALIIALILWFWHSLLPAKRRFFCLSLVLLAIIISTFLGDLSRLSKRFYSVRQNIQEIFKDRTIFDLRLRLYIKSIECVSKDIFLGLGMGNSFRLTIDKNTEWVDDFYEVDSFFLTVILKLGLLGGAIFIFLFFYLLYKMYFYLKNNENENMSSWIVGVFAGFSGVLFGGVFGANFLHSPSFNIILCSILGLTFKEVFKIKIIDDRKE